MKHFVRAFRSIWFSGLLPALFITSISVTLKGQACCTLQGFGGNAAYGSISDFDGIDFLDPRKRTQIQFQMNGSDDWDNWAQANSIKNGPLLGYTVGLNHFLTRNLLVAGVVSGNVTSVSEGVSEAGSESAVSSHVLQLMTSWLSDNLHHAVWTRLTLPIDSRYFNKGFQFKLSPAPSLEIGYAFDTPYVNPAGKPRSFSLKANVRTDAPTDNIYQFTYYGTAQVTWKYRIHSELIPFTSFYLKQGALKPLDTGVYQTRFPATLFAYGLFGGGLEYRSGSLADVILRLYVFYPFLRWSDKVLPAGFEEKPFLGLTITKAISIMKED